MNVGTALAHQVSPTSHLMQINPGNRWYAVKVKGGFPPSFYLDRRLGIARPSGLPHVMESTQTKNTITSGAYAINTCISMPIRRLVSEEATGAMADGDNLTFEADNGIGVQMRLKAPVFLAPAVATQSIPSALVKIDHRTATVVVNLLAEVDQFAEDILRNTSLLEAGPSMFGERKHDFQPPFE